jgi:hypothetical protein
MNKKKKSSKEFLPNTVSANETTGSVQHKTTDNEEIKKLRKLYGID